MRKKLPFLLVLILAFSLLLALPANAQSKPELEVFGFNQVGIDSWEPKEFIVIDTGETLQLYETIEDKGQSTHIYYPTSVIKQLEAGISPRIMHSIWHYSEYVYQNFEDIPTEYSYSAYNDNYHAVFSGKMVLYTVVKSSDGWHAFYRGQLGGII